MTKISPADSFPTSQESSTPADVTTPETAITQSVWLLKEGIAPKLGARAEGSIGYNVLADINRQQLFIAITINKGGGYFSKEHVDITKIEACLKMVTSAKYFPSKTFKEAFIGRSSNNAGFLATILRNEGLIAAAPEAETQHVRVGDWAAWKKVMLAETGTMIAQIVVNSGEKQAESEPAADHKKTLTIPRKKSP